ncbi:hypothetical protein GU926_07865 [Nibribacter ruber]|uniref:Lipocalin-like domain-containing protein n=1 Tax=Nibribacter ruber TaxID=2698458 RepID=A0A6P1NYA4_9BACT|nr:hypothetical protein [Nibribacter ruber]QHL87354.1 hypothetical protein GU926_07865 [Nibribacter ruber]
MNLKLLLVLLLLPLVALGQATEEPSIKQISKKLSGKWIVEVIELDSLKMTQRPYGRKVLTDTYIDGQLVKTESKEGYHIIEMIFDEYGDGEQKVNLNFVPNSKVLEIIEDQPHLRLKIKNGNLTLLKTYLTKSEEEAVSELTKTRLVLLSSSGVKKTLKKIE